MTTQPDDDDASDSPLSDRIRVALPALPELQQRIARWVLEDPIAATRLSALQLATAVGVSQPTVTRFCQSLGLASYQSLLIGLAREAGRAQAQDAASADYVDDESDNDVDSVIRTLARVDVDAMQLAARRLDRDAVEQAALLIAGARQVDLYGAGASGLMARELQLRLYRIGLHAFAWTEVHSAAISAALRKEGDVVIAVSASGRTPETLDAVNTARAQGAKTIALTGNAQSPLALAADLSLTAFGHETPFRSASFAARHAQLLVIDVLFTRVAQLDPLRTSRSVEATAHISTDHSLRRLPPLRMERHD